MLELIQTYSDQIVTAIFVAIPLALLLLRPKISCCRQRRWERVSGPTQPVDSHHRSHDVSTRR